MCPRTSPPIFSYAVMVFYPGTFHDGIGPVLATPETYQVYVVNYNHRYHVGVLTRPPRRQRGALLTPHVKETRTAHNAFNRAYRALITPRLPQQHRQRRRPAAQGVPHWSPVRTYEGLSSCAHHHVITPQQLTSLQCAYRCQCHGEAALHRSRPNAESPVGLILSPEVTPEEATPQAEWDSSSNTTGLGSQIAALANVTACSTKYIG